MPDARYDFVKLVDPEQLVAEFITQWLASRFISVDPALVSLFLLAGAGDEPTSEQEAAASSLNPRRTLAAVGVHDGCSLLARFAAVPSHGVRLLSVSALHSAQRCVFTLALSRDTKAVVRFALDLVRSF